MQHSTPSRLIVLAFLILALAATTVRADGPCANKTECCDLCGDDSYRCARGPCSTTFFTKGAFSISVPTKDVGFWDVVFSFYGMVPYVVPFCIGCYFGFLRRTWTVFFTFFFIPVFAVTNVILVKAIGKDCEECARPCGSCVYSSGMPSGHASNSIGLCLWIILETLLGVGRAWKWSWPIKTSVILFFIVLFVPVPYSRVFLGDHTPLQVGIGSADGVFFAILYFVVLRFLIAPRLQGWSEKLAHGRFHLRIENDFYLTKVPLAMAIPLVEEAPTPEVEK